MNNESWLKTQACGLGRSKRVGYDRLGMLSLTTWDGTFPHGGMATFFVLSTQGKSGILSRKGGQGRAPENLKTAYSLRVRADSIAAYSS